MEENQKTTQLTSFHRDANYKTHHSPLAKHALVIVVVLVLLLLAIYCAIWYLYQTDMNQLKVQSSVTTPSSY